jgi:hypothetical protein
MACFCENTSPRLWTVLASTQGIGAMYQFDKQLDSTECFPGFVHEVLDLEPTPGGLRRANERRDWAEA